MKKLIGIGMLMLCVSLVMQAQQQNIKKLFEHYEKVDGFTLQKLDPGIEINSEHMNTLTNFLDDANQLYILKFETASGNTSDYNDFSRKLRKLMDKNNFVSMIEVAGEGQVNIYVSKAGENKVTDFLLITEDDDDESVIIWATTS